MADLLALERAPVEDPSTAAKLTRADPQALEKLRNLTIARADIDGAAIDVNELREKCPLYHTSTTSQNPPSNDTATTRSLSQLDRLPLETIQDILQDLDIQTLTNLRSVSRYVMSAVDSLLKYREVMTHVPDVLRALLSTKLARSFNLHQLCSELRSDDCYLCGSFGTFLFLPTCGRCCWPCLCEAEDTLPISRAQAKESFELTDAALLEEPAMLTLPGSYGVAVKTFGPGGGPGGGPGRNKEGPTAYKTRMWLVSMRAARLAAENRHGLEKMRDLHMMGPRSIWTSAYARQSRRHRSRYDGPRIAKPPYPPYTRGPNFIGNEPRRFMAAIRFPMLDATAGKTEWGLACAGCQRHDVNRVLGYSQEVYTKMGFLRHMESCKWARRMWRKISRPVYMKVLKEHIDPETLDAYELPWEWAKDDPGYIVIKRWIAEPDQDILFEHTRCLTRIKDVASGRWRREVQELDAMDMSGFRFRASVKRSSPCRAQSLVPDKEVP